MTTQTDKGMTFVAAYVFCSPDGDVWTDVSGHGAAVAIGGGERATGEAHTFISDDPIVGHGKKASTDVTVRFVYTEEDSEPFDVARTAHEGEDPEFWVKYRVKSGGNWFSTGQGVIKSLKYPQGETADGAVIMSEFVVKCASLTEAAAS